MYENFVKKVHNDIILSNICGFDKWMDNHYAYDGIGGGPLNLDEYAKHFEDRNLPYRWWSTPRGGYVIYGSDPTGWSIQFNGNAVKPPSNAPSYLATCKSDDGCAGQGNCKVADFFKFIQ